MINKSIHIYYSRGLILIKKCTFAGEKSHCKNHLKDSLTSDVNTRSKIMKLANMPVTEVV